MASATSNTSSSYSTSETSLELLKTFTHSWRITSLTPEILTTAAVGAYVTSQFFKASGGHEYKLYAYLCGEKAEDAGHLSVSLALASADSKVTVVCHVVVADVVSQAYTVTPSTRGEPPLPRVPWPRLVSHAALLAAPDKFFPGGALTVVVKLRESGH